MFGRQAQLPIDVMYGTPHQTNTVPEYVMTLQQILTAAFANAREHIGTHQERQAESYNKRVHGNPYDQGRLVWLYNSVVPKG